jgi:hypothetical protein
VRRYEYAAIMTDPLALWLSLARQYCAVQVTLSDCGCYCVELFVGDDKICEEDKDLLTALQAAAEKASKV